MIENKLNRDTNKPLKAFEQNCFYRTGSTTETIDEQVSQHLKELKALSNSYDLLLMNSYKILLKN